MRYTTISSLKAKGFKRFVEDAKIIKVIEDYSRIINIYTEQLFLPIHKVVSNIPLEEWSKIIHSPDKLPIILINSIMYRTKSSSNQVLDPLEYYIFKRYIEFEKDFHIFSTEQALLTALDINPLIYRFTIDGVFGWINNNQQPIVVEILTAINPETKTATLSNVENFNTGDILTVGNKNIIIDTIDYVTKVITFDPLYTAPIPEHTQAICYGSILPDIKLACERLCLASKKLESIMGGRIISEHTDRYSYRAIATTTGIAEVDVILSNYSMPLCVDLI